MRLCFTRREDVWCSLCSPVQYDPYRIVIPVQASWILYTGASTSIDLPKIVQAQILGFVSVLSYHSVQYLRLRIEHAGVKRHLRYQFGSSLGKLQALLKVPQMFLWDLRRIFEIPQRFQVPYRTVLTLSIWNCACLSKGSTKVPTKRNLKWYLKYLFFILPYYHFCDNRFRVGLAEELNLCFASNYHQLHISTMNFC